MIALILSLNMFESQDRDEGRNRPWKKENDTEDAFSFNEWLVGNNGCQDTKNDLKSRSCQGPDQGPAQYRCKGRTEGTQSPHVGEVLKSDPIKERKASCMLKVVVGKGNHQGNQNGEDDCKGHGNIRRDDQR